MRKRSIKRCNFLLQKKEVATNICKLPEGTVVFEDVSTEKKRGKIAKVFPICCVEVVHSYVIVT